MWFKCFSLGDGLLFVVSFVTIFFLGRAMTLLLHFKFDSYLTICISHMKKWSVNSQYIFARLNQILRTCQFILEISSFKKILWIISCLNWFHKYNCHQIGHMYYCFRQLNLQFICCVSLNIWSVFVTELIQTYVHLGAF